ncbi:MAG TPA: PAS domain S-box protein, partial [Spirochaetota bacterium]|nr:PAS domain S-box protein [Spirochaetota bacterium]
MSDTSSHIEYDYAGDHIRSLIIRFDPRGKILRFNAFALSFFGYTSNEITGRSIFGTVLNSEESDIDRFQTLISNIQKNPEEPVFAHIEVNKGNGDRVWLSFSITPVMNGDIIHELICVGNDVTESKKMEHELRDMNESFKMMLENVPTGVFIIDPSENTVLYSNFEGAKIVGCDRESLIGHQCDSWCPDMTRACSNTDIEGNVRHMETRLDRTDGRTIHIFLSIADILFRGNPYILASFIDITKQKKTEESLLNASRQIEDILSSIVSVLIGVSIDDYVTNWNTTAEDLFGIPANDIIGKRFPLCPIHW